MELGEALCRWQLGNQTYLAFKLASMSKIIGVMKEQINSAVLEGVSAYCDLAATRPQGLCE
ncbi:MAG: hypothetical protein P1U63_13270 [Coxiellaceae bacterium]|nr:hypothetical protein [Coxiellaceae bacterium]